MNDETRMQACDTFTETETEPAAPSREPGERRRRPMLIIVLLLLEILVGAHMYRVMTAPGPPWPAGSTLVGSVFDVLAYLGALFSSLMVAAVCLGVFLLELFVGKPRTEFTEKEIAEIGFCSYVGDRPDSGDLLKMFQALPLAKRQCLLDRAKMCALDVLTQALLEQKQGTPGKSVSSTAGQVESDVR